MANVWQDQFISAGVGGFNYWKQSSITKQINELIRNKIQQESIQNQNFENALKHMMKMRQFLSRPDNILGTNQTKHGEIAEHLEVNVRNAKAALFGKTEVATFNGVGRTAPEDFILNGIKYQSKFINGTNNTLSHVLEHFGKYQDTSMNYSIPKDQYAMIEALRNGKNPNNLSVKTIHAILKKVEEIEQQTGRHFTDVVKPSVSNYADVQLGTIDKTVSNHEKDIVDQNEKIQEKIKNEADNKIKAQEGRRAATFNEGLKVAGTTAVASTAIHATIIIFKKVKSGKKIDQFNEEDWKEIGLTSVKAGGKAGLSAGSIYALTNLTSLSAPFAGAVTSAAMGITSLATDLKQEQISMDEFVTQGQILCIEAGIAAIGGAVGQVLIPFPILGPILGTVTANMLWGLAKGNLEKKEHELKKFLDAYSMGIIAKMDEAYKKIINSIIQKYDKYDSLISAAFDPKANAWVLANASISLAREIGVSEEKIIKSEVELDAFFLD